MFRLLNKSAIWHLCQCVNHWLWNSSKWPFTGAVLQSVTPWSAQGTLAVGRSVSQWCQISHAIQVRRFIHLGDAHSKQWAALNASVSIPRWRTWQHPRSTPAAYL